MIWGSTNSDFGRTREAKRTSISIYNICSIPNLTKQNVKRFLYGELKHQAPNGTKNEIADQSTGNFGKICKMRLKTSTPKYCERDFILLY
jgi:hypothetical protein